MDQKVKEEPQTNFIRQQTPEDEIIEEGGSIIAPQDKAIKRAESEFYSNQEQSRPVNPIDT